MVLVSATEMIKKAHEGHYAVGQFKLPSDVDTPNTQIIYFYGGKINEFVFRNVAKYIKGSTA